MGDGVARINGNQAQSDQAITGSPAPGTSQGVPPYSGAPIDPLYNYNQQFGAVQAAPVGPSPAAVVTHYVYTQRVMQVKVPDTKVVIVEPPERDCYFYCFDCSGDFQWYDLRGKGLCWIFLLLLMWLTVGVVVAAFIVLWCVLACLSGLSSSDD